MVNENLDYRPWSVLDESGLVYEQKMSRF